MSVILSLPYSDGSFQYKEENVTAQRVVRDTPNMKNLLGLLTDAWDKADKPRALPLMRAEPSFSEYWGGINIVNEETEGEHFWLGIWWRNPSQLQFAFAPALYDKDKVEGPKRDEFDWWPYVPHELNGEFLDKSARSQLDDIQEFVDDTLKEFAKAKRYPEQ
jgi:hypothetical protein